MKCPAVECLKLVDELEAATCISVMPLSHRSVPDRAKLYWDGAANYVICKPSNTRAAQELHKSFIWRDKRERPSSSETRYLLGMQIIMEFLSQVCWYLFLRCPSLYRRRLHV